MKQSALIQKQLEREHQMRNYGALIGQQFNVDMVCLALNDEGFGHDRIERILDRAMEYGKYFHECLNFGVESDARFEQLDNRLKYIIQANWSDLQKLKGNDRAKLRKELYRKAGICSCGRRKARKGHTTCRICAEKERIRNNRRNTNGRTRKADKGKHE